MDDVWSLEKERNGFIILRKTKKPLPAFYNLIVKEDTFDIEALSFSEDNFWNKLVFTIKTSGAKYLWKDKVNEAFFLVLKCEENHLIESKV